LKLRQFVGFAMAAHLEDPFACDGAPAREIAPHHLRLGMLGALGVFWVVVAVCLWAIL
jgi:hypothetical protein